MVIDIGGGEYVEGFHVERLPQFNTDDAYSEDALGWRAGIRAVWLLYKRHKWQHLVDLGVDTERLQAELSAFPYDDHLTDGQLRWLRDKVPQLEAASFRLRALYALKYRLKEISDMSQKSVVEERIYLAEVVDTQDLARSDMQARTLVEKYRASIQAAGAAVDAHPARGGGPAVIRVITRGKSLNAAPADMFPGEGLSFYEVHGVTLQVPEDAVELPDEPAE